MKPTLAALFFLLWALTAISAAPAGASTAKSSVVLVTGRLPDGARAFATGIIVGVDAGLRVATAAHVAALPNLTVQTQLGETLSVGRPHFIAGYDLAVLTTSLVRGDYVAARPAQTVFKEEAAEVWGYGAQNAPRTLPAVILATRLQFPGDTAIPKLGFACDRCEHGDSGAGIFSADGSLIGILAARWSDPAGRLSIMEGEPVAALYEITALK